MYTIDANDIANVLLEQDEKHLSRLQSQYWEMMDLYRNKQKIDDAEFRKRIIDEYEHVGDILRDIVRSTERLSVYAFDLPHANHGVVSRMVSKLRDPRTKRAEFLYYTQRAFELLFSLAFSSTQKKRTHIVVDTPVTIPVPAYAVHRIPDVDKDVQNTVMCVLLRGALLPSIIVSKEIQEFSSGSYRTPFALFKVKRDDAKTKDTMRYVVSTEQSYFDIEELHGKHLIFADPMNATGGSVIAVMNMLTNMHVVPASTRVLSIIASLEGVLRTARALPNCVCHTLWLDPWLNEKAYIVPGLGDAGDRLNGKDDDEHPRGVVRLLTEFGHMQSLYSDQFEAIENTILTKSMKP